MDFLKLAGCILNKRDEIFPMNSLRAYIDQQIDLSVIETVEIAQT